MLPPAPRTRRALVTLVAVLAALGSAGCASGQQVLRGYGDDARANFVDGCTVTRTIEDGERVDTDLAPERYCECVYEGISEKYQLPWDDLVAYEKEVADADDGDLPEPPEQLTKAIDDCSTTGPSAPSGEAGDGDASTTTADS